MIAKAKMTVAAATMTAAMRLGLTNPREVSDSRNDVTSHLPAIIV